MIRSIIFKGNKRQFKFGLPRDFKKLASYSLSITKDDIQTSELPELSQPRSIPERCFQGRPGFKSLSAFIFYRPPERMLSTNSKVMSSYGNPLYVLASGFLFDWLENAAPFHGQIN